MNDPSRRTDVSVSSSHSSWPEALESLAQSALRRTAEPVRLSPPTSIADAVRDAMRNPQDFPGIEQTAFEGDRVTIVAAPSLPNGAAVLAAAAEVLAGRNIRPTILISEHADPRFEEELQTLVGPKADVSRHDPSDSGSRRYLAADADDLPIYLDETLVDADWVLPIDVVIQQRDAAFEYPLFSDAETKSRLGGSGEDSAAGHDDRGESSPMERSPNSALATARQVRWLLGVAWHLRVVVNHRGEVVEVQAVAAPATQPTDIRRDINALATDESADLRVATVLGADPAAVLRALEKLGDRGRSFETLVLVARRWLDPPKSLRPAIDVALSRLDPQRLYVWSTAGSADGSTEPVIADEVAEIESPFWKARATTIPDTASLQRLLATEDYEWTDWADV